MSSCSRRDMLIARPRIAHPDRPAILLKPGVGYHSIVKIPARSIGWLLLATFTTALAAPPPPASPVAATELAFLDYLDAVGGVAFIESGKVDRFGDRDLAAWRRLAQERRDALGKGLAEVSTSKLAADDARAVEAMRKSLEALAADETTAGARSTPARMRQRRDAISAHCAPRS